MKAPRHFVILGGGTSGWMAAAALGRVCLKTPTNEITVTLIESEDIGTVGVGEATIPPILDFLKLLNVEEADFIRETQATYKLAIHFRDWKCTGDAYWHPFGTLGPSIETRPLFQHWLREKIAARPHASLMSLSVCAQMALKDCFAPPVDNPASSLSGLGYALHFDAALVAKYLRGYAKSKGVTRHVGMVAKAEKDSEGNIARLDLTDGRTIAGDFFIDCSGFKGVLIDQALGSAFEDWSHWLPCDRAVAVPSITTTPLHPYTIATAREAGWTWRIPLQSRVGNGYVYASRFAGEDTATQTLLQNLDGAALAEPRHLSFKAGRRKQNWVKNCLALGLASGFLEPLESTSIHLVFANLMRFLEMFPGAGDTTALQNIFNKKAAVEIEEIRDFLILHYCTSRRSDTPFWQYVTSMALPDSLLTRMALFREQGRILSGYYDLFKPVSWISVLDGMGIEPEAYDPLIDTMPPELSQKILSGLAAQIKRDVDVCGAKPPLSGSMAASMRRI
jgi:tryptophan 7-halogenase